MLTDAFTALRLTFSPAYRGTLIRSILMAVGLMAVLGIGAHWGLTRFVALDWQWAEIAVDIIAAFGIFVAAVFLVPPVTSLIAGFYLDEVAAQVERGEFGTEGRAVSFGRSLVLTLRFFGLTLAVNLVALVLLLVPGVNLIVFYVANGYLLGREYFQLAAMRFLPEEEAAALRSRHGLTVFVAGLIIAALVSVPILNLATPIFATIFMVHVAQKLMRRSGRLSSPASGTDRR